MKRRNFLKSLIGIVVTSTLPVKELIAKEPELAKEAAKYENITYDACFLLAAYFYPSYVPEWALDKIDAYFKESKLAFPS